MNSRQRMQKYKAFTKVEWDRKSIIYYVLLLFVSCLYPVLFDSSAIQLTTENRSADITLTLVSISYCLGLFFILMLSRYAFLILCPIIFYIGAISSLYATDLSLHTTVATAPLFFNNSAITYLTSSTGNVVFIILTFILGLAIGLVRFFAAKDTSVIRRGQAFALVIILVAGSARYMTESNYNFSPAPFAYISGIHQHLTEKAGRLLFSKEKETPIATTENKDNTVILITFEKISDTLYKSNTESSILDNIKTVTITGIEPCSQNYGISLLCTLSKADKDDMVPAVQEKSLVSLFKSAGYNTAWINVSNSLILPSPYSIDIGKEADSFHNTITQGSPNPFNTMDTLDNILNTSGNKFIIINIEGILPQIDLRYPELFDTKPSGEAVNAEYRNYMDFINAFIYETTRKFNDENATIYFAGLIGEDINNTINYNHTEKTIFGIWSSPKIDMQQTVMENIQKEVDQSWIYSTIAGCSNLKSDKIDMQKNLCNPN